MNLSLLNSESNPLTKPAIILRDLWRALEVKDKYADWYNRQLVDFLQGIDYEGVRVNPNPTNGTF